MNIFHLLVAALIGFLIGGIWYSPILFAKPWQRLSGKTMTKDGMATQFIGTFLAMFVMAYVLLNYIAATAAYSVATGMEAGFWLWLGLIVTSNVINNLYSRRSWSLVAIDLGYYLIALLAMGGLLAVW